MTSGKDTLFSVTETKVGDFTFDARVARVFQDMIARSVPGYSQILSLLPVLTRQSLVADAHYYDLGCSLGAGILAMAEGLGESPASIIGIDNSPQMLDQAQQTLDGALGSQPPPNLQIELRCADICATPMNNAAMILMNFTLQFIELEKRDSLITTVCDALLPGGSLVLSEKVTADDTAVDALLERIHHQFKADQGYSQLEIARKRDAIENVLVPESVEQHMQRLYAAGFSVVTPWIRNLQFVSLLAIK